MRRLAIPAALFCLALLASPSVSHADLNSFLADVNAQAQIDLPGFKAKLSTQFGVPLPDVDSLLVKVRLPGDAFMVLQLGQMAHRPHPVVLQTYERRHGQGWGAMAKSLGIKPGSAAFHALKRGDLVLTGDPADRDRYSKGKGKGKAKKNK
jgi:hypothetical protein